ncbi:MAG: tetratricopeptide repeat protein [Chloroflexi bacterium]|uniref:Tetratricopeptide repeat protein n=1 Tax=Candidatus Chlorohelix allophototropha TaxID=3003348 RepID=A0A8T7M3U9_9CHLR|nr:tetratricopeptide repeat protein [Chloroflexota bacterium]
MTIEPARPLHNLPHQISSFIGRQAELAQLKTLVLNQRLVTLTGTGGVGKTRLAIQTAASLADTFPDGVWFVPLATLNDPNLVPEKVASSLGLKETTDNQVVDTLKASMHNKTLLLVLDNCEHLLEECARLSSNILASCPDLRILATSREALMIDGETTLRVPSLPVPALFNLPDNPEQLAGYEAVRLFLERARQAVPDFKLNGKTARPVVQICVRLDGIPLALELAAARLRSLTVEQLTERLDDRFRLLSSGNRVALPRQQTLKALVDWSFDLLEEREKVVLRRLAVFSGKWRLVAAEAICSGEYAGGGILTTGEVLDTLLELVNKSLVQLEREEGCYYLLETIRQYSLEKLQEAGEEKTSFRRHRDYYLKWTEAVERELEGPEQLSWKWKLEQEFDNLRAAIGWSIEQGEMDFAARFAIALHNFWMYSIPIEGIYWLDLIHQSIKKQPLAAPLQANLLNRLGILYHNTGRYSLAVECHHAALAIWQKLADRVGIARALMDLGWCYFIQVKLTESRAYAEESLAVARETGDKRSIAAALHLKGITLLHSQRFDEVFPVEEEALALWRELGDAGSLLSSSATLLIIQMQQGHYEEAKSLLAENLLLLPNPIASGMLGNLLFTIAVKANNRPKGLVQAARLMGKTRDWYLSNYQLQVIPPNVVAFLNPIIEEIRQGLGEERYALETATGQKLTLEEFKALAAEILKPDIPEVQPESDTGYPANLSEREVEVLRLVAQGLSNPEIAEKLVLSRRTVEAHLRSIFNKLDVTSRTAAARFAVENGLLQSV